jgi:hypothetical protein
MKTRATIRAVLLMSLWMPQVSAAQAKAPLIDEDIIQMVSNGLPDNVVIGSISANEVNFDVSPNGLLTLKKAIVSDKIVEAMLAAEAKKRDASHPIAAPAPASVNYASAPRQSVMGVPVMNSPGSQASVQLPKVTLVVGERKMPLQASSTEIANSKGKGGSKAGGILKGFGQGILQLGGIPQMGGGSRGGGLPRVAYTWALPGRNSRSVLPTRTPSFEIEFSDIPGIDPDGYEPVIVQLIQTKDNWRLVETSKDKFDKHGNDTRSTKTEAQTPVKVTSMGRGHLQVTPASELGTGEYALVLHPRKDQKEFAGVPAPNVEALFTSVWDFSVPTLETVSSTLR